MITFISCLIMGSFLFGEQVYIAHRAADLSMPENTLDSMKRMHQKGARWFEIDVHLMKDGHIAVIHDEKINRTTTGRGKITKMSQHDLHSIFVVGGDGGEKIPMLTELMDYAFTHRLYVMIEIKGKQPELVDKIDELINRYDVDLFTIYSFEKKVIQNFCQKNPKYAVHWSLKKLKESKLIEAKKLGVNLNLDGRYAQKSDIEKIQGAGLKVHVYTVNDEKRAKELFDYGVNAIITDSLIKGGEIGES